MAQIPGTQSWSPNELQEKEKAIEAAPRAALTLIKSQIEDQYQLVDMSDFDPHTELAFQIDAQNHLLALLNFPDKLRGFLDCILGLAKYAPGTEFSATNWEVGTRSRSGRAACSDDSMEKWVARKKQALEEWMANKSFHFVKITKGDFNWETNRNEPTKYKVFFNQYVIETVQLAKSLWYWRAGAKFAKFQGRAIREAARRVIQRIPEAPPLKPTKVRIIPEDVKFDRRHKTIVSFLKKNRDVLAGMNLAHEEYFMFLVQKVIDPIAFNPTGTTGAMLTPEADEPDRRGGILRRIERGTLFAEDLGYTGDDFNETVNNVMGDDSPYTGQTEGSGEVDQTPENDPADKFVPLSEVLKHRDVLNNVDNANSLNPKVKHGGTKLSETGGQNEYVKQIEESDGGTKLSGAALDDSILDAAFDGFEDAPAEIVNEPETEYMEVAEVQSIIENWRAKIIEKVPPITSDQRFAGAWEISWQSFGDEPKRTEDALNFAILKTARNNQALSQLRKLFIEYVIARIAYVQNGVPNPKDDKKLDLMRGKLTSMLIIPGTDSS